LNFARLKPNEDVFFIEEHVGVSRVDVRSQLVCPEVFEVPVTAKFEADATFLLLTQKLSYAQQPYVQHFHIVYWYVIGKLFEYLPFFQFEDIPRPVLDESLCQLINLLIVIPH